MSKAEGAINTNQNHAIFVGFAPVHDPKFSISVVVEHGKSGSGAAAPIGKDVMIEAEMLYDKTGILREALKAKEPSES
jgi:cell division protein FtsI/penicillin-binding protein 2